MIDMHGYTQDHRPYQHWGEPPYRQDGMGSWLSSYLTCGGIACKGAAGGANKPASHSEINTALKTAVLADLLAQCKTATTADIDAAIKGLKLKGDDYKLLQTDPNAVTVRKTQIINVLAGKLVAVAGCTPGPTPNTGATPGTDILAGGGNNMGLYLLGGGLLLGAFFLMSKK